MTSAPGLWQRCWGSPAATRLGYRWQVRRRARSATDEPHPTLMRTPAAQPRRVRRLCRGQCPGRSRYSFVPGSVAIRKCGELTPRRECPVRPGSRSGRVVRRLLLVLGAALRWGSGGFWEGASAPSPLPWDSFALSPFDPPTHLRGAADTDTADQTEVGTAGVPSKRPASGVAAEDTRSDSRSSDNGLSSLRLAPSAPVRRRLAGRAVAQCLTKRLTSKTSLV